MTFKTTKLRDAIAFGLWAASLSASGLAMAQDAPAQQQAPAEQTATDLDTVVVTGTRIQSQTVTSSSPVTEIQKEEFQYTGATRAEDLINQYPQLLPAFDSFTNNGATGFPTVDLRGLGSQRTLTLVDGFRLPPSPVSGAGVDISIVPPAAIKRVDLLTGGASAVYGSDAIAGVVNFVLDDEFEGVSLSAGYSAYQHNNDNDYMQGLQDDRGFDYPTGDSGFDGASRNIDLVLGSSFADGKGNAMMYATWRKNDPLFQGQRDYSSCGLDASGTVCGGSDTNATGNFYAFQFDEDGNQTVDENGRPIGYTGQLNPDGSNSFVSGYGAPYNFAPINYYQRPDERYSIGGKVKYEINEHFRPYMDFMFMNRRDSVQIAESGTFFITLADQDCANPIFGTFCEDLGIDPTLPLNFQVARRNIEGGPRITQTENTQWRVVAGVEGALDEAWSYNASFLHGRYTSNTYGFNDFLFSKISDAILGCQAGSFAGCLPYDVFTPGGVTAEAANALAGVSSAQITTELNSVNAYVTGDTGRSLPWVDENVSLVMGAEWRETRFATAFDSNSLEGNFAGSGAASPPVSGKTNVSEVFLETVVPLFRSDSAFKAMDLDMGYRLSDYENSGTASTWKVGLAANFADKVRVRGSFNRAIRAPDVGDLFTPQVVALFAGSDPCSGPTPTFTAAQCVNTGVPLNRYGTVPQNSADQNNQFIGGNPNLAPETAETWTAGLVFTPTSTMQFNVDYFDIKLTDAIATITAPVILEFCAKTGDPFLCGKINRNPVGLDLYRSNAAFVENLFSNLGEQRFQGVDLGAMARWDLGPGRLTTSLQGTYFIKQETAPLPGLNEDATYDCVGVINPTCGQPEWRHIANARYALDRFTFNLRWRYFGEQDYLNNDGTEATADKLLCGDSSVGCLGDGTLSAYNYFDASATALIGEYTEITLGVNNIADKEPPLVGSSNATNGNAIGGYDQAGRFIFGSVTFRF